MRIDICAMAVVSRASQRLRKWLRAAGKSQFDFAQDVTAELRKRRPDEERAPVQQSTVSGWSVGKHEPGLVVATVIEALTDIPIDDWTRGPESESSPVSAYDDDDDDDAAASPDSSPRTHSD